jgi:hypothetical protein
MGTNFYVVNPAEYEDSYDLYGPKIHVGKRSAAGLYCFDCGITLHKHGKELLHTGKDAQGNRVAPEDAFYKVCPLCKKGPVKEDFYNGSAGLELGFHKDEMQTTGVRTCCSFNWCMKPDKFVADMGNLHVWDEYGAVYTAEEFKKMRESYPIHFTTMLGKHFS